MPTWLSILIVNCLMAKSFKCRFPTPDKRRRLAMSATFAASQATGRRSAQERPVVVVVALLATTVAPDCLTTPLVMTATLNVVPTVVTNVATLTEATVTVTQIVEAHMSVLRTIGQLMTKVMLSALVKDTPLPLQLMTAGTVATIVVMIVGTTESRLPMTEDTTALLAVLHLLGTPPVTRVVLQLATTQDVDLLYATPVNTDRAVGVLPEEDSIVRLHLTEVIAHIPLAVLLLVVVATLQRGMLTEHPPPAVEHRMVILSKYLHSGSEDEAVWRNRRVVRFLASRCERPKELLGSQFSSPDCLAC
eukprot:Colp12_sorted_trinity150504_noHs@26608